MIPLADAPRSPLRTNDPVILVVDDEPAVLSALRRCFRREFYEVITAGSGDEALGWLSELTVDLVITDQRMPNMKGTELVQEILRRFPRTQCVMLTGYRTPTAAQEGRDAGVTTTLYKPWDDSALRETVRHLLADESPEPLDSEG